MHVCLSSSVQKWTNQLMQLEQTFKIHECLLLSWQTPNEILPRVQQWTSSLPLWVCWGVMGVFSSSLNVLCGLGVPLVVFGVLYGSWDRWLHRSLTCGTGRVSTSKYEAMVPCQKTVNFWKNEITDTRAKMGFLHKRGELSLRDRIRCLDNWRLHGVKPLLLCPERSQLGWFEHLISVCSVFGDCLEKLQVLLLKWSIVCFCSPWCEARISGGSP